jgi:hypothetical protein
LPCRSPLTSRNPKVPYPTPPASPSTVSTRLSLESSEVEGTAEIASELCAESQHIGVHQPTESAKQTGGT